MGADRLDGIGAKKPGAIPLKKAASGFRVLHAFGSVLGNDAGCVQLGGS